jgi:peptide/nickel transport system permease protein
MRIIDIQLSFPPLLLAIALVAVLGAGLQNVVLVLVIRTWVLYARIVRADVLSVREREYVAAARALGARLLRILFRHVLPNVLGPSLVVATFAAAEAILVEAGLSFLGLGIPPPTASWGRMISAGRGYIATAWWLTMIPGLAMLLSVLAINILGDWLRDRFDPRLQT